MTRALLIGLPLLLAGCAAEFRFEEAVTRDAGADAGLDAGGDGGSCPSGQCRQCARDADCPGLLCDVERGRCLTACDRDDDTCDRARFERGCRDDLGAPRCTQCEDAEQCGGALPRCAGGQCVECDADADCGGRRCDRATGRCAP
jgi:hypothetical protein